MAIALAQSKTLHRAGSLNPLKRFVKGETPLPKFTASGNTGMVNFSDGGKGGLFIHQSDTEVLYQPYNGTQLVTITATDSIGSASKTLSVFGTFPLFPQKGYEIEYDDETKTKKARDGTEYFREDEQAKISWKVSMERRLFDEAEEVWNFCVFHRRVKLFWVYDEERKMMNKVRRITPLPQKFEGANSWTQSIVMRGNYAPTLLMPSAVVPFRLNAGSVITAENWLSDRYYTSGDAFSFGDAVIDNSGVSNPAPDSVYRICRYHPEYVDYLLQGFPSLHHYLVRLHFAANVEREMNLQLQGVSQVGNIIVPANYVAAIDERAVLSDANGDIHIRLNNVDSVNAILSGIEILEP